MPDVVDALLSIREAASALDLTEAEVRRRIADGELRAVRLGAERVWKVRVPAREFERLADTAGAAR